MQTEKVTCHCKVDSTKADLHSKSVACITIDSGESQDTNFVVNPHELVNCLHCSSENTVHNN